jgi:hypothetical protein
VKDLSAKIQTAYALASSGQPEAFLFLMAWHGWCHAIDDHVDERRDAREAVDLCADAAVLFSSVFYHRHTAQLAPVVALVAAKYRSSLKTKSGRLQDALRIAGNDMVLAVAYLTGGEPCIRRVSEVLWPIVEESQLQPESHG